MTPPGGPGEMENQHKAFIPGRRRLQPLLLVLA